MSSWIFDVREKIGTALIPVNSAGGWIENDRGEVLLQKREAKGEVWGFPGGIMELEESVAEAAIREVFEETGYIVEIVDLVGVYSKYFHTFDNGDQCQTVTSFFRMKIVGGSPRIDHEETFDLKFVDPKTRPKLFSQQHHDMWDDAVAGKRGVYR